MMRSKFMYTLWELLYLQEVSPMLDGQGAASLPDYVIPMWLYLTETSQELFSRGRGDTI